MFDTISIHNKGLFLTLNFISILAHATESERKDLLSELEIMKRLKPHPHVIKLLGCVTTSGEVKYIVLHGTSFHLNCHALSTDLQFFSTA